MAKAKPFAGKETKAEEDAELGMYKKGKISAKGFVKREMAEGSKSKDNFVPKTKKMASGGTVRGAGAAIRGTKFTRAG
jgi:hypothetical protein